MRRFEFWVLASKFRAFRRPGSSLFRVSPNVKSSKQAASCQILSITECQRPNSELDPTRFDASEKRRKGPLGASRKRLRWGGSWDLHGQKPYGTGVGVSGRTGQERMRKAGWIQPSVKILNVSYQTVSNLRRSILKTNVRRQLPGTEIKYQLDVGEYLVNIQRRIERRILADGI